MMPRVESKWCEDMVWEVTGEWETVPIRCKLFSSAAESWVVTIFEDATKVVVNINNFLDSSSWSMKLKLFTSAHL
jgi:hypothetical protein